MQGLQPEVAVSRALRASLQAGTRIVLVAGADFADDTFLLSEAMVTEGVPHRLLVRWRLAHRWDSGWLDEAAALVIDSLSAPTDGGDADQRHGDT